MLYMVGRVGEGIPLLYMVGRGVGGYHCCEDCCEGGLDLQLLMRIWSLTTQ